MPRPSRLRQRRPRRSLPPLAAQNEAFEGAKLLDEHAPAGGVVLWRSLRDVNAWIDTSPDERSTFLRDDAIAARQREIADADLDPELWAPLLAIADFPSANASSDGARLVHACRAVARWAGRSGAPCTELAFTEAAARLAPEHPALAYAVGRLSRDRGEYARSETWLRTAVRLGRGRDWPTYVLAHLSLGTLYRLLGNVPAARALFLRATRAAGRRRLPHLQGAGYHDLLVLAAGAGQFPAAHRYAARALDGYGDRHPRLAALAYDVGCVWFLCGYFERSLPVLEAALPHFRSGPERSMAMATVARAAAGAGDGDRFESAWAAAVELLGDEVHPATGEGWLNLARGAHTIGDGARTTYAARRAIRIADTLRLARLSFAAESVLSAAASVTAPGSTTGSGDDTLITEADNLVARLVRGLERSAAS
jgi:tetratricopeptide (TPR) repeat protein